MLDVRNDLAIGCLPGIATASTWARQLKNALIRGPPVPRMQKEYCKRLGRRPSLVSFLLNVRLSGTILASRLAVLSGCRFHER